MRDVEERLVEALSLRPLPLDERLVSQRGRWKDADHSLRARAYSGPSIRYARFVEVEGPSLDIANALCLPEPDGPPLMLGLDFVSVAPPSALLVGDLIPLEPERASVGATVATQRAGGANVCSERALALNAALPDGLTHAGPLPPWAARWFSPQPLFVRVAPHAVDHVSTVVRPYVNAFVDACVRAGPVTEVVGGRDGTALDPHPALAAQARYLDAHRSEDRGLGLLSRIFCPDWTQRFLEEVLFPRDWTSWRGAVSGAGRAG